MNFRKCFKSLADCVQEVTSTLCLWRECVKTGKYTSSRPGSNLKWCWCFKIQAYRPTVKTMQTWLIYVVKQMHREWTILRNFLPLKRKVLIQLFITRWGLTWATHHDIRILSRWRCQEKRKFGLFLRIPIVVSLVYSSTSTIQDNKLFLQKGSHRKWQLCATWMRPTRGLTWGLI